VRSSEVLSLEEEPGDSAQRNAAARHAAELIIDIMARRSSVLGLLAAVVLIVPLAYGLYPVASAVEGVGTIEPLFEDLVLITSDVSGIVTRMALLEEKLPLERIDAADANLLFPDLPVTRESIFVRLRLAEAPPRERWGAPLLITLTSPARPRLWRWLSGA